MGGRLELRNVYKDFGGFKLDNVNLTLEAGEYFVLVGPTGSGKTLLLETINGFHRVDYGIVLFDGRDQNGNQRSWPGWAEGRIIDWRHTPELDTSLGDAAGAYGDDHTIEAALRRVVFVRKTAHPFVIVIDTMQVDPDEREHDFEALWRTAEGNRIDVDGNAFTIVGRENNCYGEVLLPTTARLRVVAHHDLPQLRACVRTSRLEMVTVLAPFRRGDNPPDCTCERHAAGDYTTVVQDGSTEHTIRAGTRTVGPLQSPRPVEYAASELGVERADDR